MAESNNNMNLNLTATVGNAVNGITQVNVTLQNMGNEAERQTNRMSRSFRNLGRAVQAAMGSTIIKAGAELIKTQEKMSLSLDILRLKNSDMANQLERTAEASFGMASKTDMVAAANKALAFGIDLSNGRLEKLIKLSAKTAAVVGTDVKSAFDDLITGVAKESKMILDNLGVMVNLEQVYTDAAEAIGKTKDELSRAEKQAALMDEVLRQMGKSTEIVSDQMMKMGTQGSSAIARIESGWTSFTRSAAGAFVYLSDAIGVTIGMMTDENESFFENWADGVGITSMLNNNYYKELTKYIENNLDEEKFLAEKKKEYGNEEFDQIQAIAKEKIRLEEYYKRVILNNAKIKREIAKQEEAWVNEKNKEAAAEAIDEDAYEDLIGAIVPGSRAEKALDARWNAWLKKTEKSRTTFRKKEEANQKKADARAAREKEKRKKGVTGQIESAAGLIALDVSEKEQLKHSIISLENEIETDKNEIAERNAKIRLKIRKEELDAELDEEEKAAEESKKLAERRMNYAINVSGKLYQSYTSFVDREIENERASKEDSIEFANQRAEIEKEVLSGKITRQEAEEEMLTMREEMQRRELAREQNFAKEFIGEMMVKVGGELVADGTKNMWIGGGKLFSPTTAVQGASEMAYGAAEIGTGMTLGYTGTHMKTPTDIGKGAADRSASASQQQFNISLQSSFYGSKKEATRQVKSLLEG